MTNLFTLTPAETGRLLDSGEAEFRRAAAEFDATLGGEIDRLHDAHAKDDLDTARHIAYELSCIAGSVGHPQLGSAARCLTFALEKAHRPLTTDPIIAIHLGAIRRLAAHGGTAGNMDGRLLVEALYALLEHRGLLPMFAPTSQAS